MEYIVGFSTCLFAVLCLKLFFLRRSRTAQNNLILLILAYRRRSGLGAIRGKDILNSGLATFFGVSIYFHLADLAERNLVYSRGCNSAGQDLYVITDAGIAYLEQAGLLVDVSFD
jgi:hypothetical protein